MINNYNIDANGILNIMLDGQNYRTVTIDGQEWIVADDLAKRFGIRDGSHLVRSLPDDVNLYRTHKVCVVRSNGIPDNRDMLVISEAGLDLLCMRSNNPELRQFQYAVLDIIHSVRHNGAFIDNNIVNTLINDPQAAQQFMINYQQMQNNYNQLKQERDTLMFRNVFNINYSNLVRARYEQRLDEENEIANFGKSVMADRTTISIGSLAKFMYNLGLDIGRNRLCELLREDGWLMKSGSDINLPTQRAIDSGYMQIGYAQTSKGTIPVARITRLGQEYFMSVYCNLGN